MTLTNMKCPVCGATELTHDTRDLSYAYKGETTVISAVRGDFCRVCSESILDSVESDRVMQHMRTRSPNRLTPPVRGPGQEGKFV